MLSFLYRKEEQVSYLVLEKFDLEQISADLAEWKTSDLHDLNLEIKQCNDAVKKAVEANQEKETLYLLTLGIQPEVNHKDLLLRTKLDIKYFFLCSKY